MNKQHNKIFNLDYNNLIHESEVLIEKYKTKYFQLCLDQLKLKITDSDLILLLKLELYLPIFVALKSIYHKKQNTVFLGIVGVNGSGKTTLAEFLTQLLQSESYRAIHFSMDDLYPIKSTRLKWAKTIHPNLKTRLMYDNELVKRVFQGLNNWKGPIKIPQFDKGVDDRAPEENWLVISEKPDFVIVEGVFPFAKPIEDARLSKADKFINSQVCDLTDSYDFIDLKLVLLTDSIKDVIQFRQQQEIELQKVQGKSAGMSPQEIESFIRYFQTYLERYTWPQEQDPRIDFVITLDSKRRIIRIYSPKNMITYIK